MKNLSDGCKQHFSFNLHYDLDAPFANGFQNDVISHVYLSCNNGFINDESFWFECHVLRCARIDDPIIFRMIISIQGNNKHLFHSYDILGARMLWKPKEARILKNFIEF
jgi:hypothetical protein